MSVKGAFRFAAVSLVIASLSEPAWATGFFLDYMSVPGLGRAGAGDAAAANDPSTIFLNAAGMTELWNGDDSSNTYKSSMGVALVIPTNKLKNAGSSTSGELFGTAPIGGPNAFNPGDPSPVGNSYAAQRLANSRWYVGLGMTAPFGLGGDFDDNWFGRYDATEVELVLFNFGPVVAYRLSEKVSIGGGIDVQYAKARLTSAVPFPDPFEPPSAGTDGRFLVKGSDWSVGFNVGILYKPTQAMRVGVAYRSGFEHDLDGTAIIPFAGEAPLSSLVAGASSQLNLPSILAVGGVVDITPKWSLFGGATWERWSVSEETRIKFDGGGLPDAVRPADWKDGYTVALGVEHYRNEELTLRAGVKFDRSPVNDRTRDTTFADDDRLWLSAGATYKISKTWTADFAFTHLFVKDTSVDIERAFFGAPSPIPPTITSTRADVQSFVDTVAVGFRYEY